MDYQILNTEIRAALPILEKAAIGHELNVHSEEKRANGALNKLIKLPDFFENGVKDFENSIEGVKNAKEKLRSLMTNDIGEKRKEKKILSFEVGKQRKFREMDCVALYITVSSSSFLLYCEM